MMIATICDFFRSVILGTGNVIKEANSSVAPDEELFQALKSMIESRDIEADGMQICRNDTSLFANIQKGVIELGNRMSENPREDIIVSAKIFLLRDNCKFIEEAINCIQYTLDIKYIDSAVLSYVPIERKTPEELAKKSPSPPNKKKRVESPEPNTWASRYGEKEFDRLIQLYNKLAQYAKEKDVRKIGVADLDAHCLEKLYDAADMKPSICHINYGSTCVVPPALKNFCDDKDIQMLTHSDPHIILKDEKFCELSEDYTVNWVLRYQVHVRCRSVITARGYAMGAEKLNFDDSIYKRDDY